MGWQTDNLCSVYDGPFTIETMSKSELAKAANTQAFEYLYYFSLIFNTFFQSWIHIKTII